MGDRVPLPPIPGLLAPYLNTDRAAGIFGASGSLVRVYARVDVAPSGGTLTLSVRTATGGGGSGIDVTIADGETEGSGTGGVAFTSTDTLYCRVTGITGSPVGLAGWFEIDGVPSVTAGLTTLAIVKDQEKLTASTYDSLLNQLIAAATEAMQQAMDRRIVSTAITAELHDGMGFDDRIALKQFPVIVPPNVVVRLDGSALTLTDDFAVDEERGILYRVCNGDRMSWAAGRRNISVDYTAGYAVIPSDLVQAATEHVRHLFHMTAQSARNELGLTAKAQPEGGSITLAPSSFLHGTEQVMKRYRRF